MAKRSRLNGAKRFLYCGFVFLAAFGAAAFGVQVAFAQEATPVEEGVYEIRAQVSDKALDIVGASTVNGTNVQTYAANATAAQFWRIEKSGDHYAILNSLTGIALDVAYAGMDSGTNVQVYEANETLAQQWDFIADGNGGYEIRSALNGLMLDVNGAGKTDGTNVQVYAKNDTDAQKWSLSKLEPTVQDGIYTISSAKNASAVLDVENGSIFDTARVQAWTANGTLAQKWEVSYSSATGFYTVVSAQSGKSLDIAWGNASPGTMIQQYAPNGSSAQSWRIVPNGDGTYALHSVLSDVVLDLWCGDTSNGARVQTWVSNGTDAQKWNFAATDLVSDGLYQIESALDSQFVLDVRNGSLDARAQLQVWSENDTLAQKWMIRELDNGSYSIKGAQSGFYLADDGGSLYGSESDANASAQWSATVGSLGGVAFINLATGRAVDLQYANAAAGTIVSTYPANNTGAQAWHLTSVNLVNDGYYVITNRAASNLALDVESASLNAGARVQVWESNETDAQKWYVENAGDGWCTIMSANSGLMLDVMNASTASGTKLHQYTPNYSSAQYWRFSVADQGGVEVTSRLGDLSMTARGDRLGSGSDAIVATPQSNTSFGWLFTPTTYTVATAAPDVWGDSAYVEQMKQKADSIGSSTNWFCTVDESRGRTVVFERAGANWVAVKTTNVVTSGNTFDGIFTVTHKARGYWKEPDCYNVNDWWVCFVEAWSDDYNGHLRYDEGAGKYDDGQGFHYGYSSGGCTAIPSKETAKWIYDNVSVGSTVVVF